MTMAYRRSGGIAALAAAAAIGLAACGGSSSPHVASLGNSSGNASASTTTTLPTGNPTQLLDEWASCMRSHGDPDQVDPTIDANKVIHITFPAGASGNGPVGLRQGVERSVRRLPDRRLHGAAGRPAAPEAGPGQAGEVLPVHAGQRDPGLPRPVRWRPVDPDPHPGSDLNPNNPTFQNASKLCAKKTGVPGLGGGTPSAGVDRGHQRQRPAGRAGRQRRRPAAPSQRWGRRWLSSRPRRVVADRGGRRRPGRRGGGRRGGRGVGQRQPRATASSSGGGGSVATAAVVRTNLAIDGAGRRVDRLRRLLHRRRPVRGVGPAGGPGPAAADPGPAGPGQRRDHELLRRHRRRPGVDDRPEQRQHRQRHLERRRGQAGAGLRRAGGVLAGVQPGHPEGQPGPARR